MNPLTGKMRASTRHGCRCDRVPAGHEHLHPSAERTGFRAEREAGCRKVPLTSTVTFPVERTAEICRRCQVQELAGRHRCEFT